MLFKDIHAESETGRRRAESEGPPKDLLAAFRSESLVAQLVRALH